MRNEIDNLRKQKYIFDTIYAKLEKGLQIKKYNIQNLVNTTQKVQTQKDQIED